MVTFSTLDYIIIAGFFLLVLLIGFIPKGEKGAEDYLLSGRNVGLALFVLTNVATWYGGVLGVGEFTYRYGLLSWFTQGFPYYIFAILFGIFFAKKIRGASLFTIPDKIEEVYGKQAALLAAIVVFVLVLPAPYLLMLTILVSLIFKFNFYVSLGIALLISIAYLFKGGYKADLFTDAFEFFVMFIGFLIMIFILAGNFGGINFLKSNLPPEHLTLTGGASPAYILVWFLIALWTFTDPGFHQRCYAAKTGKVAKYGILISVFFWLLFDLLTTATGLYSRALLPQLPNPTYAFPMLAEKVLSPGLKGVFYAAMFATVLSTLNSYFFLSGTTFGNDFVFRFVKTKDTNKISKYTKLGLIVSAVISIVFVVYVRSIINMWYLVGSIFIPGMILLIIGAYYPKFKINGKYAALEIAVGVLTAFAFFLLRPVFEGTALSVIEPMIVGLIAAVVVHTAGLLTLKTRKADNSKQ